MRAILLTYLIFFAAAQWTAGQESPYAQAVLRDAPVIYLQFAGLDDADNKTTSDTTGKQRAELAGKMVASDGPPGTVGNAAKFDGRTTVVNIANDDSLRLDALTVEFWMRTTQSFDDPFWPGSATLNSNATPGAGSSDWTINAASPKAGEDQGRLLAESGPAGKTSDLYLYSPAEKRLNDNRWHHIAWTRSLKAIREIVLSRGGLYHEVHGPRSKSKDPSPLKVKQVLVDERRYIVCHNEEQARKDRADRDAIVEKLRGQLKQGSKSLVGNKGFRKYLSAPADDTFQVDEVKVKQDARFDGKWVLQTDR